MAKQSRGASTDDAIPAADAKQLTATLASADSLVTQGIVNLRRVHQARLAAASRMLSTLKTRYGAGDARVTSATTAVAAINTTIARISMLGQQLAEPAVEVAKSGWALRGQVVDAQLKPAARFTVFLVDARKVYLEQYGFSYTDANGYFLINYAGGAEEAKAKTTELFVEVADTKANPVFLSDVAFQPVTGQLTTQDITLPAGRRPIGDPPAAIRAVALPKARRK